MADIVLKGYSENDVTTYENITKLRLIDEDDNVHYFSKGYYATDELPKLLAPTSTSTGLMGSLTESKYFYVYHPSNNGAFAEKVQFLSTTDGNTIYGEADTSLDTYTKIYANAFNDSIKGAIFNFSMRLIGTKVANSDVYSESPLVIGVSDIKYDLGNVTLSQSPSAEYMGQELKFTLTPDEGYYLPKSLPLKYTTWNSDVAKDVPSSNYTYVPDDKTLQVKIPYAKEVYLPIHATSTYWLRNPRISIEDSSTLYVNWLDYNAETTNVICDGEIVGTIKDAREGLVDYDVSGYTSLDGTTYKISNSSVNSSHIETLTFFMATAGQVNLYVYTYNYGGYYDTSEYTVISKVDNKLSGDETTLTATSNVLYTTYDHGSSSKTTTLTIDIPAGKHTIDIMYISKGDVYRSTYCKFRVETPIHEGFSYSIDLSHLLPTDNYKTYLLSAQSVAEGCDSSDIVEVGNAGYNPNIDITDGMLTITNKVPEIVTAFELYVDDVLTKTVAYNSTSEDWSIDLTEYSADTIEHTIYIKGIGDGVNENQSNIVIYPEQMQFYSVETVSGASYGFTLNSSGYYQSGNKGKNNSYAICKVVFNTKGSHLYLDCINYAENNYDFGILSNIDKELTLSNTVDSTNVFKSFKGYSSSSVQTVDYGVIASGEHFIYVKFRKDSSSASGNDTLQFKVRFE